MRKKLHITNLEKIVGYKTDSNWTIEKVSVGSYGYYFHLQNWSSKSWLTIEMSNEIDTNSNHINIRALNEYREIVWQSHMLPKMVKTIDNLISVFDIAINHYLLHKKGYYQS
jgi:hypothetical protein